MIKKWFKHVILKESIKDIELNRILDKISKYIQLTDRESNFLDLYNYTQDSDYIDYSHLSLISLLYKLSVLINKKKKIYCDICDRNGKISELIININSEDCILILRHSKFVLKDSYLYNITYNFKKDIYSLTSQDEYYEKIPICN